MAQCTCFAEQFPRFRRDIVVALLGFLLTLVGTFTVWASWGVSTGSTRTLLPALGVLLNLVGMCAIGLAGLKGAVDYCIYRRMHVSSPCGGVPSKL